MTDKEYIERVEKYGNRILEVGSGSGMEPMLIKIRNPSKYVVMPDIDDRIVKYLGRIVKKVKVDVEVIKCDTRRLPFADKTFDVVCHQGLLEHFPNEEIIKMLGEQKRVAKYIIFDVPLPENPHGYGDERKDLTVEKWYEIFGKVGLKVIESYLRLLCVGFVLEP
jgi:ubiquinone/menaquinone biosynthesis C-methylase UbiE